MSILPIHSSSILTSSILPSLPPALDPHVPESFGPGPAMPPSLDPPQMSGSLPTGITSSSGSSSSTSSRTRTSTSCPSSTGTFSTTVTSSIVRPTTFAGNLSLTSMMQTGFTEETTTIPYTVTMTALENSNQTSSTSVATAFPASSTTFTPPPTSRSTLSTRDIIIVIASLAGLFLIAILIFLALRRRAKKSKYEAPAIVPYAFAQPSAHPSAHVPSVKLGLHMGNNPLLDFQSDVHSVSSHTFLASRSEWEVPDESAGTSTRIGSSDRERLMRKIRSLVRREVAKNERSVHSNFITG
ncbi:hypothetical protein BV22DRAFT_1125287 [Leucogyrophana mollusca]|uniref:Uncharacterized protein n=1 Tax=Leucogyrophana mollusca TaxID=85980 RepID=A0ACB8BZ29_9AGAM|nr:hypothetical protein BV22DRAFT_1125287 [Leucogyrophana mollusca]